MEKQSVICIIPARGGSKRLPGKNIKDFRGKPMIAWSIEAARNAGVFDRILVSTDDEEIQKIAVQYGADCPFLRQEANDDMSHISAATHHALLQAQDYYKERYDVVVQLFANCPIRSADTLKEVYSAFVQNDMEFMISVCGNDWVNPWFSMKVDEHYKPEPLFPDALKMRTQDLPKLYFPNGSIWVAKTDKFLESKNFYGPGYNVYPVPWYEAVDIDDQDDWDMAEVIHAFVERKRAGS